MRLSRPDPTDHRVAPSAEPRSPDPAGREDAPVHRTANGRSAVSRWGRRWLSRQTLLLLWVGEGAAMAEPRVNYTLTSSGRARRMHKVGSLELRSVLARTDGRV